MLPVVKAFSTIAVLPRPWRCVEVASPADCAVCLRISPRMYDSVKRLEPTFRAGSANATVVLASATRATIGAAKLRGICFSI
jgi:hypothetical protein